MLIGNEKDVTSSMYMSLGATCISKQGGESWNVTLQPEAWRKEGDEVFAILEMPDLSTGDYLIHGSVGRVISGKPTQVTDSILPLFHRVK